MPFFLNEHQKVYFNVVVTGNKLAVLFGKMLKKYGLSNSQYNVLRILRGQKGSAISAVEIQGRMLHPSSNVSRIIDKLTEKGYATCQACVENMRRNNVFITTKGLKVLEETDQLPIRFYQKMEELIPKEHAEIINKSLDALRNGMDEHLF